MSKLYILLVFVLGVGLVTYFVRQPSQQITIHSEAILVNADVGLSPCVAIDEFVQPFKDTIDSEMNTVIGYAPQDMTVGRPQSLLSNFVADLLLERANTIIPTAISVVNMGGLRNSIKKGDVTVRSVFAVMPFENECVIVEMSGEAIWQLANEIVAVKGEGFGGMQVVVKNNTLQQAYVQGKLLDRKASYRVVTSDYLLTGKDGLTALLQHKVLVNPAIKVRDVILEHIVNETKQGKPIIAEMDNRYQIE
ncbi:MAG: 5'-nucleotidase C-terminal domain-containing protein [Paludibacteraceae bacterium]|nr:5'-nucleotidase C-terminal domain-containing protein [Paludibacteraceae bacterium]